MLRRTRRVHFVGIGGIGMSGIAELLANLGYEVSGSDLAASDVTARLERLGVTVRAGHDAAHVGAADVVVVSSAVSADNPEVLEAGRRGVPVIPRAEMLAELMRLRYAIAIAGSHGKTTTTSMIALVLERAGLDPTAIIGGRLMALGGNAKLGQGEYVVAEADESDRSFLRLTPTIAVLTNVDREHLENYGTFEELQAAFVAFANKVPFYGAVVACADDPTLAALLPAMTRRVVTYGFDGGDVRGSAPAFDAFSGRCTVTVPHAAGAQRRELRLRVPGRHSLLNALAAVAVGLDVGVPLEIVLDALQEFAGVERRFERKGEIGGVLVVDDYGHHPTEIAAVIAAARAGFDRRILVAFQPHRYTRTARLARELGEALAGADEVVLADIYGAGEAPIPGATVETVAEALAGRRGRPARVVKPLGDLAAAVAALARPGDLVLTLGAGSIGHVGDEILRELARRAADGAGRG